MFYSKPWADALIVLIVVLLFVGPKRLPTLGRSLGQGFREFKDGLMGGRQDDEERESPALPPANDAVPSAPAAQTAPAPSPDTVPGKAEPQATEVGSSEQRS